jgi:2,3-bisphosphoglycerate-independent phosphoglycerate mutase
LKPRAFLFLILDGAADRPVEGRTPLSEADTPGLDRLAETAACGTHYPVGPGIAPESDLATLSLLGYEPEKYYTGRGPLEALGAGLEIKEGSEVAFRANFATIDPATRRIIDRRVGRSLSSEEAHQLAAALDGMELGGGEGYARVRATVGHRAVVIIGSRSGRLSAAVQNIDPAYIRKGLISEAVPNPKMVLPRCEPLEDSEEARRTCRLVDDFIDKSIEVLDGHPVNQERARRGLLKANAILLRDAGDRVPRLPPVTSIVGLAKAYGIAEMPVEVGIARTASMEVVPVSPPSGSIEKDMPERLEAALSALRRGGFVYVHLKGPDEPGHDGDFERKKEAIEKIDKYFIQPLLDRIDLSDTAILVTSDHATPWSLRSHSGDPVPWMLSHEGLGRGPGRFDEMTCSENARARLQHGWELLPLARKLLGL